MDRKKYKKELSKSGFRSVRDVLGSDEYKRHLTEKYGEKVANSLQTLYRSVVERKSKEALEQIKNLKKENGK